MCKIIKVNTITHEETTIKRGLSLADAIEKSKELDNKELPFTIFDVRYEHLTD